MKMASMKPTLLDQGTETWDEESGNTRSGRLEQAWKMKSKFDDYT